MIIRRITELGSGIYRGRLLVPIVIPAHLKTYPSANSENVCKGIGGKKSGRVYSPEGGGKIVRAARSGKVRLGFIPDEWFLFLHSKTGVSGPYLLMLGLANYACSKEILVMEHEYYSGLSIALILYIVSTKFGRQIGAALDQGVDAIQADFQKSRDLEIAMHNNIIKEAKLNQMRAKAQEMLMAAKKENITFQLEAFYRERLMMVYRTVRGRLQYHEKKYRAVSRIQQRWMLQWILDNVYKSITEEFKKQALNSAIRDLAAATAQTK